MPFTYHTPTPLSVDLLTDEQQDSGGDPAVLLELLIEAAHAGQLDETEIAALWIDLVWKGLL